MGDMVDEHRFMRRCTHRICEENGPADPVLKALSLEDMGLLAASGGDLDRAEWAQWLPITYAHTYATVTP
jgi:hypothetical protein